VDNLNEFRRLTHEAHRNALDKGFYEDVEALRQAAMHPNDFEAIMVRLKIARLGLVGTEVAEAIEEVRKGRPVGSELADIVIRTMDLAGFLGIDLASEIANKMQKNLDRPAKHGKLA